ncbi:MAG TPA: histidine--tRNA ligase [Burkholderiaceae bacterium]|nr:histidine--tRNA ligase [Burkholderiaceae bacterium]
MANVKFAAVRGMNDLLPAQSPVWEWFEARAIDWLRSYGYQQIRTPVVEHTDLFVRGIGEVTDIVEREMYSFEDRANQERLTLRPEFTAGTVRAAVEHSLTYDGPKRVWSMGPLFRHERPQRGRFRQFHQVNVEALGFAGPDIDAELIVMLSRLWKILGIKSARLEINCLGQVPERAQHRAALVAYFEQHQRELDADSARRLTTNPLRILDSKNPAMTALLSDAPQITTYLGGASRRHFEGLQELLTTAGIAFKINPRLVRGLDYYNLTVFEWITDELGSQGTLCGGGRYDTLIELLGGKPTPAIGFAIGIERVIECLTQSGQIDTSPQTDIYVVHKGGATARRAFVAAEQLRDAGLDVIFHAGEASLKSQMKRADASGAEFAVIIGETELASDAASVKNLRVPLGGTEAEQRIVPLHLLADTLVLELSASEQDH